MGNSLLLIRLQFSFLIGVTVLGAQTQVLTYHNDVARTGLNPNETILTPANVKASTFGKLFQTLLDGRVDAQPLYLPGVTIANKGVHNLLIVATENDSVYALDADTGAVLWRTRTLKTFEVPSDPRNCGQVVPEIGITGTPVINMQTSPPTIYVVAMSKAIFTTTYHQRLHALNMSNGQEEFGGPVDIRGSYPGTGDGSQGGNVLFNPADYKARAGLLLSGNTIYIGWSSHCDIQPYTGWIMAYNPTTLAQTGTLNITPNGEGGAFWNSGAGIAADASGNLFALAANGTFDATLNNQGFPVNGDFGNAILRVSTANNSLSVADYFTMSNTVSESNADEDLGSGGALLLPDMQDNNGATWHLVIGAGKDTNIYLANRDNLGKFNPNSDNAIYQELTGALGGGVFSAPAYFNGQVYFGAVGDSIRAFPITNARLAPAPASQTANTFPYPGASPSISANGTSNAILWAVENVASTAALHAYDATNLATELYNSNQAPLNRDHFGAGNKFMTPTIVNGKVYVGTPLGVAAFGLLSK